MTDRTRRIWAVVVVGGVVVWATHRAIDLALVSPVHWPLLLPRLVLEIGPGLVALALARALVRHGRAVKWLAVLFVVTVVQATLVLLVSPDIGHRYEQTVRQSLSTWTDRGHPG